MRETIESLFEVIRASCPATTWSRGVALSRAGGVGSERDDEDEIRLRVASLGSLVSPAVSLFPQDEDWACECASRDEVCEHVVAAVLAVRRAQQEGDTLTAAADLAGIVAYRLTSEGAGLSMRRVIVQRGKESELTTSLAAITRGRVDGPATLARRHDMEIERLLGAWRHGALPPGILPRLLPLFAETEDLTLDGRRVHSRGRQIAPVLVLEDERDGFRLALEDDPSISQRLGHALLLCGDELCLPAQTRLTARERKELRRGLHFRAEQAAELVTRVLPTFEGRVPIDLRSKRLPRTRAQKARLIVESHANGLQVEILATIVYGDPPSARLDGERLVHLGGDVPIRDLEAERRLKRQLARLGLAAGHRIVFSGEEAITLSCHLAQLPITCVGEGLDSFFLAPPVAPRLCFNGAQCEIFFETLLEDPAATSAAPRRARVHARTVIAAWREGQTLVPLIGGGWAPFPAQWIARNGQRVLDILDARDEAGIVPKVCAHELAELCEELGVEAPEGARKLAMLAEGFETIPSADLPHDLTATLRPYQRQGVNWLSFLREAGLGALLADDMGLGKTLETLCIFEGRCLVVAPTSVLHNWANELRRFRPGLSVDIYHGTNRRLDPQVDVTLTTYAILRLDEQILAELPWKLLVLDEAQAIKNPDSQVAKAAFRLSASFRVCLTGTPVENRLEELWSQFHFLNRGLLGTRRSFDERYARPIAAGEDGAAEHLRRRIRPFVLRRLKRDVAPELPPRSDMTLYCVLSDEERMAYDALRAATRRELVERLRSGGGVLAALEALLRLRQAACHRALIPGQQATSSSKIDLLTERLEQAVADGHKALVFSQWTSMLDLVEPHLHQRQIAFLRLDGTTRDRVRVVSRFQDDASAQRVLLISLKAGGTGLNLTAADHVFLVDPWWNPAVEDQAADRTHRIGQERPVFVYRLVAEDTVEERILALQESKRALAEAALAGAAQAAALSRDDLLALLD